MKLAEIEINDFGGAPVWEHNYPCPIYWRTKKSVLACDERLLSPWIFHPSWDAQREGWRLVKAESKLGLWILITFFKAWDRLYPDNKSSLRA